MLTSGMTLGFLALFGAGLGWMVTGALLSHLASKRLQAVTALAPQMLVALCLAWVLLPDYGALSGTRGSIPWRLAGLMVVAGLFNAGGVLAMQRAMQRGHNGVVWAVGQSGLVWPFLAGVMCFGEPLSGIRLLGVAGIVASLAAFGLVREGSTGRAPGPSARVSDHWFLLALTAMLLLGLAQTIISLPSHIPEIADTARLRVPMFYLGHSIVYVGLWCRRPEAPTRRLLAFSAICGVTAMTSTLLLFQGLDRLAVARMASLGFPVGIGASILFFAAYSRLILREPFTFRHAVGMAAGLFGLIAMSVSR